MKKLFTAIIAATATLAMNAEGYQVNTFSAKQEGMGHVGVALKLGSESNIFNPAAVAFMNKTVMVSGGVSAIKATAKAEFNGKTTETSNKVSTPMNLSAAFRIYDNLYAGVSFYTPYGSSIKWGKAWEGAILNQSVDLKVYTVQPTVSWRILPNFSIGAGLMISWGNVNLNKALVTSSSLNSVLDLQYAAAKLQYDVAMAKYQFGMGENPGTAPTDVPVRFGEVPPASVNLTGDSELAVGFNVGAMYEINKKITIGASFRSKMNMKVNAGNAEVEYADEVAQAILGEQLDHLNYTNFKASMPCPYILTAGISYKPIERLTLAFDAQLNGWSTYEYLDFEFVGLPAFNQHLKKNYKNAMTYHIGGEFAMTNRLDLRAGLMIDCNPCDFDNYNPETPGTTKLEPSIGFSFRPISGLSVDVAFMYVNGRKVNNATSRYDNFLANTYNTGVDAYNAGVAQFNQLLGSVGQTYQGATFNKMDKEATVNGNYKVTAIIPAIGISYSF